MYRPFDHDACDQMLEGAQIFQKVSTYSNFYLKSGIFQNSPKRSPIILINVVRKFIPTNLLKSPNLVTLTSDYQSVRYTILFFVSLN